MQISKYQQQANKTILPDCYDENYMAIGLGNEVGEVLGIIKKRLRGDEKYQNAELFTEMIEKEIGDVLWYLSGLCTIYEIELDVCAEINLAKIKRRKELDMIKGDGDDR